ncbi:CRISPR-associated endoribonuclease Cas6 [Methanolapillus millepedarum]|uniref:CRISPR associated protein Cas6 C-terminal domain-containing protein n=1 Tax=Methanolapillus millepedarum TaxID=3028296 RepID=A0AA96ZUJ8_9EURY|nr:hypothetical protein MsAc7_12410 [Methanosarcinaceae archaeon Ac7]
MRSILKLEIDKNILIPFDYQYHLASMIYNSLSAGDRKYAEKMHVYQKYKFFTFSWLDVPKRTTVPGKGIQSQDGTVYLQLSSPNTEFLTVFLEGLFQEPVLKIGNMDAYPMEIRIEEEPSSFSVLKTISPICLRTKEEIGGELKERDLLPNHSKFYENMRQQLKKKYEIYYKKECDMNFEFEVLSAEPKRMKIKDTFVRCSNLIFSVNGDYDLIRFGYECGFGEKNSMGFGMVTEKKL